MLFVYGTLQDADVLAAVLGWVVELTSLHRAIAPGYRATAYPRRVYPGLVVSPGDAAPGHVIHDLLPLDLAALDAFEGDEYVRGTIEVLIDGQRAQAQTYLPTITMSALAPVWSLSDWTSRHKPSVITAEVATAEALRRRLFAARSD